MTVTLNRKNNGKQFTVVDQATRSIIHWHRPGDHLPFIIEGDLFDRDTYVVTQADVDAAKINKRVQLKVIEENWEHMEQHGKWTEHPDGSESTESVYKGFEDHVLKDAYINGKGQPIVELVKAKASFGFPELALCSVVGASAVAVGYELVKAFA